MTRQRVGNPPIMHTSGHPLAVADRAVIGVRTHADDTFSHLLDDDRIDDAASPPRVICCMA
jgi:hypothetical protein